MEKDERIIENIVNFALDGQNEEGRICKMGHLRQCLDGWSHHDLPTLVLCGIEKQWT
jgi:hypothetical protein